MDCLPRMNTAGCMCGRDDMTDIVRTFFGKPTSYWLELKRLNESISRENDALMETVKAQRKVMIPLLKFYIKHWQMDKSSSPADVMDAVDMLHSIGGMEDK